MKKVSLIFTILLLISGCFYLTSCKKDNEGVEDSLTPNSNSKWAFDTGLNLESSASEKTISFDTTKDWKIINNSPNNISISPQSGANGNATISITTQENTTGKEINSDFEIRTGSIIKDIQVRQASSNEIVISSRNYHLESNATKLQVDLNKTLDNYHISISNEFNWIKQTKSGSKSNDNFYLEIQSNNESIRNGIVIVEENTKSDTIFIHQKGIKDEPQKLKLNIEQPGTLSTLIKNEDKYNIKNLTLTGTINGSDIRFIRDMAGINIDNRPTDGRLDTLDISNAKIVNGGDFYFKNNEKTIYTEDDKITENMFASFYLGSVASPLKLQKIILPNNAISIESEAFLSSNIEDIVIPNHIISIGNSAFKNCEHLVNITLNNTIRTFGEKIFENCYNLKSIDLPKQIEIIPTGTFKNCNGLTSIIIPDKVKTIDRDAFNSCNNLASLTLNNTLTNIGGYSFHGCSKLKQLTIPESVTDIDTSAFSNTGLQSIKIPDKITVIHEGLFSGCDQLVNITLSDKIGSIETNAFWYCNQLSTITVPSNVKNLGDRVFTGCSKLGNMHFKSTIPPKATESTFEEINTAICTLYVPKANIETYKATSIWKDFKNIIGE